MNQSTAPSSDPALRSDDLASIIFPRSVALIGVSERTTTEIVDNVLDKGIPAVGVHPRHTRVHGLACVPSIAALSDPPEAALVLVGHARLEAAFDEALAAGVRAFVIPGLGNEAGTEGPVVAARLGARAREAGVPVIGFNGMGVAVAGRASLWIGTVPETFIPGHVSVVVHSGSIGEALLAVGPRIGFRAVVSSGSEAVRDVADLCAFFAADPGTRAVGLFLETVRRPDAFARSLALLARAEKPVVCCRVGRSEGAARAVLAHSGALVGSATAFSAVLRAYGVIEVLDYPEFVEVLEVLGRRRRPPGIRLGGVSNSGGEAALLADQAEAAGIPFAPLPDEVVHQLRTAFPNYVAPQNPVDAWAVDETERVFPGTFEILARSGRYDILIAHVDQSQYLGAPEAENALFITRALTEAVRDTGIFPAVTSVQPGDPTPAVAAFAREHDVALLRGSGSALRALAAVARWRPRQPPTRDRPVVLIDGLLRPGALPEFESSAILEHYAIAVTPRRRARTPDEAAAAAQAIGFPVAVKVDGPAHKSQAGGVILNLRDVEAVREAARRLGGAVLVARQVPSGLEVYAGYLRDPGFGPILVVGPGGRNVEALGLSVFCLAPIDRTEAFRMIDAVPIVSKGAAGAARDALADILMALGWFAIDHPRVSAVDVNPVILHDGGAVAVDALVVVEEGDNQ